MVTDDDTPRTGFKEVAWVGSSKTDLSALKTRATAQADKDLIVARYREAKEKLA